jgi:hypothetical protein
VAFKSREAEQEYNRRYAAENRERIQAYKRQWAAENRERLREQNRKWRAENRERIADQKRTRYLENREQIAEQHREYYIANRERIRAQRAAQSGPQSPSRKWYRRNREIVSVKGIFERHGLTPHAWASLWEAQDGLCYLCGLPLDPKATHIDHDHSCCGQGQSCSTCRRGLAHRHCNNLIGFADDDPGRLRRIANELEAAKRAVAERLAAAAEPITLF